MKAVSEWVLTFSSFSRGIAAQFFEKIERRRNIQQHIRINSILQYPFISNILFVLVGCVAINKTNFSSKTQVFACVAFLTFNKPSRSPLNLNKIGLL